MSERSRAQALKAGDYRSLQSAYDLQSLSFEASGLLRHSIEADGMDSWMRQASIVIGLTIILTFPVTVISGDGSPRPPHRVVAAASGTGISAGNSHGWHQRRKEMAPTTTGHRMDR